MARNCEKKLIGLNRIWLEKQRKEEDEKNPKRPHLKALHSATEVKKWIPGLKREIDYYLDQLSGARQHRYPDAKIKEFENKVEDLEKEYKRFVKKVFELDPSTTGIPWQPRGYVSKRKTTQRSSAETRLPKKICTPLLENERQACVVSNSSHCGKSDGIDAQKIDKVVKENFDVSIDIKEVSEKSVANSTSNKGSSILGLDYDSSGDSDGS